MTFTQSSPKSCTECGNTGHSRFNCPRRPKKPLQTKTVLKPKKRMKQAGGVTKKWLAVRAEWLRQNPPDHLGNYQCHYCRKDVPKNEITLDHYHSRSRRPDLRFELSNLVPCCYRCNRDKGSLSGDEYVEILRSREEE
jgi:5-methylcytosine-specific restriction endonuclease McrA